MAHSNKPANRTSARHAHGASALKDTELPRRDSAIVVGVTAAIVGLIVLWMTQTGATYREIPAEDSALTTTIVAGE